MTYLFSLQPPLGGLREAIVSGSWARAQELIASGADVHALNTDVSQSGSLQPAPIRLTL